VATETQLQSNPPLAARGNAFLNKFQTGSSQASLPGWLATMSNMGQSWQRCAERYRLNPTGRQVTENLTARELREQNQPLEEFLQLFDHELDFVQSVLAGQVHCVNLSNPAGILLKHRNVEQDETLAAESAGSIWSESVTGTNGVGTCAVEKRPVVVVGEDHFLKSFSNLTCVSAPIHASSDEMLAILNVTLLNPAPSLEALAMLAGLVQRMALRIENDIFCSTFRDSTLVRMREESQQIIIALDGDERILGGNAAARKRFGLNRNDRLWSVFEKDESFHNILKSGGGKFAFTRRDGRSGPLHGEIQLPPARGLRRGAVPSGDSRSSATRQSPAAKTAQADAILSSVLKHGGPTASQLLRASTIGLPILLLGETGSGKDTIARAMHDMFEQTNAPFVAFNCAAVPESLIDSELFGYAGGAFTGASRSGQQGRIEQAEGGTLFLDEIGDMPLPLQTRLLRFLETGEVSPLGAGRVRRVETRIIAATNLDLPRRVAEGSFRQDLYYRLAGIVMEVPPLRARTDFEELVQGIIASQVDDPGAISLTDAAMARLRMHSWPGNVRELRHLLLRAICNSEDGLIDAGHLSFVPAPGASREESPKRQSAVLAVEDGSEAASPALNLDAAEKLAIRDALIKAGGDIDLTAARLGISRSTLYRKLRRHDIRRETVPVN